MFIKGGVLLCHLVTWGFGTMHDKSTKSYPSVMVNRFLTISSLLIRCDRFHCKLFTDKFSWEDCEVELSENTTFILA